MRSPPAYTFLRVENRPAIFEPDGKRNNYPDDQPQGIQAMEITARSKARLYPSRTPLVSFTLITRQISYKGYCNQH